MRVTARLGDDRDVAAGHDRPPAGRRRAGEEAWPYRLTQGRLPGRRSRRRLIGPDGDAGPVGRDERRRAGGPRAVDHRRRTTGDDDPREKFARRLAADRRRRHDQPGRLPHADRPGQGRHQVRRRVDLLGRAGERADGAPGGRRGRGRRRTGREVGRAAAGHRRGARRARRVDCRGAARLPRPSGSPSGSCRSAGRSSTRCPRPPSASSTRR